ncbi:hypothetical protein D3273_06955 [Lichenibacterium minor]|jgi:hypothetical protein|uniref:MarR family transcriptional regulator n=1 Tax=Lichenibacterium minor TaxID=2316528 RepID=A0A4Q2U7X6_9HYPH|nr:hypothetical protein [Lichenibacterium minor]RYC32813.1 hypothetical protein D3273_06955 [Lichenibacterium minor]
MTNAVWKIRVDTALTRLQRDRWTAPAVRYMEIIDEVAAGRGSAADIARRAGSPDLVAQALGRVTQALLGDEAAPRLDQGGWYESDGERYRVAPDFAAEWLAARDAQRRMQARQSV